jgi:hypothetical protein
MATLTTARFEDPVGIDQAASLFLVQPKPVLRCSSGPSSSRKRASAFSGGSLMLKL